MNDDEDFKVTDWHIIFENEKGTHRNADKMVWTKLLTEKDIEYLDATISEVVMNRGLWHG